MIRVVLVPTIDALLAPEMLAELSSLASAISLLKSMNMSNTSIRVENVATKSNQKKNEHVYPFLVYIVSTNSKRNDANATI